MANALYFECPHPYDKDYRDDDCEDEREEWKTGCLLEALDAAFAAAWAVGNAADTSDDTKVWYAADKAEEAEQCKLLREIVGNPFRPSP